MSIQNIRRAFEVQPRIIGSEVPEWFRNWLFDQWQKLAQETRLVHNSIESFTVAVAGGAGSSAVTLPVPYPSSGYSPTMVASWATTHSITAISATGFTDTFGTAAPGGGGTLYVVTVF